MADNKTPLRIDLVKNSNQKSDYFGHYYGRVARVATLSTRAFAQHIADHGSIFTLDIVTGVLRKLTDCLIEQLAEGKGVKLDGIGTFYPTAKNVKEGAATIADAKDKGADLVFLPIYYTPASQILIAAKAIEYAPVFFGVDGMDGILTMEGFDPALAEGVMLLTPFVADAKDDLTVNFVQKYQEQYGEVPNQFAADAYDCVYAMVEAAKIAEVQNGEAAEDICDRMISAMQELQITGLTGAMTWSANGEVDKVPTAMIIKDGAYVGLDN